MSKKEELLKRMREGIPVDEAASLVKEVQREEALERAPKENPFRFEDERAQRFSDLWFSQRKIAAVEQKDKVGLAYISKVLGLGDEVVQRFAQGDRHAYHKVGMKQSAIPTGTDTSEFWKEVGTIFSNVYTDGDIDFLVKEGGIAAVLHFLWQLEVPLAEESPVLGALAVNAHAYK